MSPPADAVPRTPDHRSSTHALFTAFRALTGTGSRLKSPTPPPVAASATSTPSIASPHAVSQRTAQPVTGGPPGLDALVVRLDSSSPFAERAAAVDEICCILEQYPIRNVLGLWSVASDLLLPEQPDDVAKAGYRLLTSCVSWPKLSTIERSIFFDAASLRKTDRYFDQRLHVINVLTKRGRDIEACESSIIPFIISSLDACYKASCEARTAQRGPGKRKVDSPGQEADNFARLMQYAIDICKFNAKIFTDDDLELLLGRAVAVCQDTEELSDVEACIKLFDTTITYVHVPQPAVRPCVEVLCTVYSLMDQLPEARQQAWSTLKILFQSHIGGVAVLSLLHTLLHGPLRATRPHHVTTATYHVLQILLLDDGHSGLPLVPMALLCPALKASITASEPAQETLVIELVVIILSQPTLRDRLLSETDVGELIDIICVCAERDDWRRRSGVKNADDKSAPTRKHNSVNNRMDSGSN